MVSERAQYVYPFLFGRTGLITCREMRLREISLTWILVSSAQNSSTSEKEAEAMEPQRTMLLEVVYDAMEDGKSSDRLVLDPRANSIFEH